MISRFSRLFACVYVAKTVPRIYSTKRLTLFSLIITHIIDMPLNNARKLKI